MKYWIALFLLLPLLMLSQQKEIPLTKFETLKVFDRISIQLVASDENKLVLEGFNVNDVEVVQKNNEVKIRMRFGKILQGEDIVGVLFYQKISEIEVNEGASLSSNEVFKTSSLKISNKEGSDVLLTVETDQLTARVGSGATLTLKGTAKFHDVLVNTGAVLEANELKTLETNITCNTGGEATIFVQDKVNAKTRLGGSIVVEGNPETVTQNTSMGGSIKIKK
ncbi:MAG: head GIN domain-containing protein [Flavobacterium sp.]